MSSSFVRTLIGSKYRDTPGSRTASNAPAVPAGASQARRERVQQLMQQSSHQQRESFTLPHLMNAPPTSGASTADPLSSLQLPPIGGINLNHVKHASTYHQPQYQQHQPHSIHLPETLGVQFASAAQPTPDVRSMVRSALDEFKVKASPAMEHIIAEDVASRLKFGAPPLRPEPSSHDYGQARLDAMQEAQEKKVRTKRRNMQSMIQFGAKAASMGCQYMKFNAINTTLLPQYMDEAINNGEFDDVIDDSRDLLEDTVLSDPRAQLAFRVYGVAQRAHDDAENQRLLRASNVDEERKNHEEHMMSNLQQFRQEREAKRRTAAMANVTGSEFTEPNLADIQEETLSAHSAHSAHSATSATSASSASPATSALPKLSFRSPAPGDDAASPNL